MAISLEIMQESMMLSKQMISFPESATVDAHQSIFFHREFKNVLFES